MKNPFDIVKDFEAALCDYTGAPYCVTTTSCTMALLLAVSWHLQRRDPEHIQFWTHLRHSKADRDLYLPNVEIPRRTYIGVPMSIIHAGGRPTFRDEDWSGAYQLKPLPVWDSARRFHRDMWEEAFAEGVVEYERAGLNGEFPYICVSFHWSKTLGIEQGGAILHGNNEADKWLRMARFDGRQEGANPAEQTDWILGYHAYMSPETAAKGLMKLGLLTGHEPDLPNSNYPDLSTMELFR